jgi:hypothetical protein
MVTEESAKEMFEKLNISNMSLNKTFDDANQGLLETNRSQNVGQKGAEIKGKRSPSKEPKEDGK